MPNIDVIEFISSKPVDGNVGLRQVDRNYIER